MSELEGTLPETSPTPLRTRTVKNLVVVLGFRALTVVYNVVKARYLDPTAVGIVASGENFIGFAQNFADPGIERAAVQVKGEDRAVLNTALWIRLALALPCYAALWVLAPWLGTWVKGGRAEDVAWVIRLVGANLLIGVPSLVPSARFTRNLLFGRTESAAFAAIVVSSLLGIWLLRIPGMGFRAVAIAAVANIGLYTLVMAVVSPRHYALVFDRASAGRLFAFARFQFFTALLIWVINNIDNTILMRLRGLAELGVYAMAFTWGNQVVQNFTQVASKVMFPTLSRLQGDPERFRKAYLTTLRLGAFLVCPLALGLAAVSGQFVPVVLGAKWDPAVTRLLPYWCVYGCLRSFANVHGDALAASGHPKLVTWTSAVFVALVVPIGIWVTPSGGALALTETFLGVSFFANLLAIGMIRSAVGAPVGTIALSLLRPLLAAGLMAGAVLGLAHSWPGVDKHHLLVLVLAGMVAYVAASAIVQRRTLAEAWGLASRAAPRAA